MFKVCKDGKFYGGEAGWKTLWRESPYLGYSYEKKEDAEKTAKILKASVVEVAREEN